MPGISSITVGSLTAVPTLRGNKLAWVVTDPWSLDIHYSLDMVEVYASTTNDRGPDGALLATKVGEGIEDFLHAGLVEEQTWYYWIRARDKVHGSGQGLGDWHPSSATAGVACKSLGQAGSAFTLQNGKIVATVVGNALTVSVKTAAGNDPSGDDPVFLAFRNPVADTGNYQIREISSALSITVPSGGTLGTANGVAFRIWVVVFDDSGTLKLGLTNCILPALTGIQNLDETSPASGTAVGTGSDDGGVLYTSSTVATKPFRILGFLTWNSGLATAGAWSAGPDAIQLFGPGMNKPGDVLQTRFLLTNAQSTTTAIIPLDDTIPLNTEGALLANIVAIVCSSAANVLETEVLAHCSPNSDDTVIVTTYPLGSAVVGAGFHRIVSGTAAQVVLRHRDIFPSGAGVGGVLFFGARIGTAGGSTLTINGVGAARLLGGVLYSGIKVTEYMG